MVAFVQKGREWSGIEKAKPLLSNTIVLRVNPYNFYAGQQLLSLLSPQ